MGHEIAVSASGGAAALEPRLRRLVPLWALVVLALWAPLVTDAHHSWDDADPEILNSAWRLACGQPLYHSIDAPPWVVNPYTPLYHVLAAAALRVTGLSYWPARLVSLVAFAAIVLALVRLARRYGRGTAEALWSAALLLLVPAMLYNVARPHPQMLAVALSLWAFVLFESPRRVLSELASPLLAVLAVYTKQDQIFLPVALGAWLLWRDRPRLLRYAAAVAVLGLVPVPFLQAATGGTFLESVVGMNFLPYSPAQIAPVLVEHAGIFFGFLGLALARLWPRLRRLQIEPLDAYFALLVPVTVASLGRAGAHGQYVVELLVVGVVYLLRHGGVRFGPGREAVACVQLGLLMAYAAAFVLLQEGPWDRASLRSAPAVRALLSTAPGPILSEQGSFPLFTRGEIHVQLFHFAALARQGRWDEGPLLREAEEGRLAWVVTEFPLEGEIDEDGRERFTAELRSVLAQHYVRRAFLYPYYVYRPREAAARPPS
jgi:Dolichyl-phosphate-mannose-protein mannosyltransferase